ncbi:MAG: hypothetical protein ACXWMB_02705 [Candidatus Limnocylindria bacterium]
MCARRPLPVVAVALTMAAIVALIWLAGRIYTNSVLHFGARITLTDALRGR